ncbi:glucose-6-phosphate isomerase [Raoultella terrigena]|nr:glucose-6-phosphate isomerase [Raoultella terrigena]
MQDRDELKKRMLLFGVVTYAAGRLGEEPVRSQGHIHRISQHSGWSPPELYEIWQGKAIIYMQERVEDDPGRCFAVIAEPGDKVLVPPGWGHATISADPEVPLTFGAWCDREYGFEYDAVRAHKGLAWYPLLQDNHVIWQHNSRYLPGRLQAITPRRYVEFGLTSAPILSAVYRRSRPPAVYLQPGQGGGSVAQLSSIKKPGRCPGSDIGGTGGDPGLQTGVAFAASRQTDRWRRLPQPAAAA